MTCHDPNSAPDRGYDGPLTGSAIANVYFEAAIELGLAVDILAEKNGVGVISRGDRELVIHGRWVGINDLTPTMLCSDKHYASTLLSSNGLPVPRSIAAYSSGRQNREVAARILIEAAQSRYPVCIKPVNGTHGFQVVPDIRDEEELLRVIYTDPAIGRSDMLIESHCSGRHYRVIVAYGEVIGCVERKPPTVSGNGCSTLAELVQSYNRTRNEWDLEEATFGTRQAYIVRRRYRLDPDSVVPEGSDVVLDDRCNLKVGGSIHFINPTEMAGDARKICIDAAGVFELEFAGLDLIGDDIRLSSGGSRLINEVNTQPAAHVPVPTMTRQQRLAWPTRLLQLYFAL